MLARSRSPRADSRHLRELRGVAQSRASEADRNRLQVLITAGPTATPWHLGERRNCRARSSESGDIEEVLPPRSATTPSRSVCKVTMNRLPTTAFAQHIPVLLRPRRRHRLTPATPSAPAAGFQGAVRDCRAAVPGRPGHRPGEQPAGHQRHRQPNGATITHLMRGAPGCHRVDRACEQETSHQQWRIAGEQPRASAGRGCSTPTVASRS